MGALPRTTTFVLRDIHLRGIDRCINVLKITDIEEIKRLSTIPEEYDISDALTQQQKMALGKMKKAEAKAAADEFEEQYGTDEAAGD